MMKSYDGAMVMPANYAVVTNEEMTYLDGGGFLASAVALMTLTGGFYKGGQVTAQRVYYRGYRNHHYQKVKWKFRSICFATLGAVGGGAFVMGFENKFYSL